MSNEFVALNIWRLTNTPLISSNVSIFCEQKDKKKKYEPPIPTRVGKKKKKTKGPDAASKLPLGMQK